MNRLSDFVALCGFGGGIAAALHGHLALAAFIAAAGFWGAQLCQDEKRNRNDR